MQIFFFIFDNGLKKINLEYILVLSIVIEINEFYEIV